MKPQHIHPSIKASIKNDLDRSAPARLRMNIMDQVMKIHAAKFHVPSYNGLAVFGLLACALIFAIPTLLPEQTSSPSVSWEMPALSIPTWLWFSICAGLSLFAADSLLSQRSKKSAVGSR